MNPLGGGLLITRLCDGFMDVCTCLLSPAHVKHPRLPICHLPFYKLTKTKRRVIAKDWRAQGMLVRSYAHLSVPGSPCGLSEPWRVLREPVPASPRALPEWTDVFPWGSPSH